MEEFNILDSSNEKNNNLFNEVRKIYEQQYNHQEEIDNKEEININDYELAEEESEFGEFVGLLNIYTCYFKQVFRRQQDETMFDHIEYDQNDSTNKCMELLYEEINKLNKSDEPDKDVLYSPDDESVNIDNCRELYILYLDDFPTYVCKQLLPLMRHLAKLKWANISWSIIPIKNT